MFWAILAVIVSIGVTIWAFVDTIRYREFILWLLVLIVVVGTTLLATMGIGLSNLIASDIADTELQLDNTYELYALNDNIEDRDSEEAWVAYVEERES